MFSYTLVTKTLVKTYYYTSHTNIAYIFKSGGSIFMSNQYCDEKNYNHEYCDYHNCEKYEHLAEEAFENGIEAKKASNEIKLDAEANESEAEKLEDLSEKLFKDAKAKYMEANELVDCYDDLIYKAARLAEKALKCYKSACSCCDCCKCLEIRRKAESLYSEVKYYEDKMNVLVTEGDDLQAQAHEYAVQAHQYDVDAKKLWNEYGELINASNNFFDEAAKYIDKALKCYAKRNCYRH